MEKELSRVFTTSTLSCSCLTPEGLSLPLLLPPCLTHSVTCPKSLCQLLRHLATDSWM